MTKDEALRLALEVMNLANSSYDKMLLSDPPQSAWRYHNVDMKLREAITAIEAVLEAKDEPWEKFCDSNCVWTDHHPDCRLAKDEPDNSDELTIAYMSGLHRGKEVAQRTWVGLTDEDEIDWEEGGNLKDLVKAIEAKLKEKNA
jgi:hypothetical protein